MTPTSRLHASTLLLLVIENRKVWRWVGHKCHNIDTVFFKPVMVQKLKAAHRCNSQHLFPPPSFKERMPSNGQQELEEIDQQIM
jgi:HJR/Mrr/RecB family endonuclease